jgi:hypothetical protein
MSLVITTGRDAELIMLPGTFRRMECSGDSAQFPFDFFLSHFVRCCVGPRKNILPQASQLKPPYRQRVRWGSVFCSVPLISKKGCHVPDDDVPPVLLHFHDLQYEKRVRRLGLDSFCKCRKIKTLLYADTIITGSSMPLHAIVFLQSCFCFDS